MHNRESQFGASTVTANGAEFPLLSKHASLQVFPGLPLSNPLRPMLAITRTLLPRCLYAPHTR